MADEARTEEPQLKVRRDGHVVVPTMVEQRFVIEAMRSVDARESLAALADKRQPRLRGE